MTKDTNSESSSSSVVKQGFRYVATGIASALIELLLFLGLYEALRVPVAIANVIALVVATTFNFSVNKTWSFKSSSGIGKSLIKYLILFAFNLCFSTFAIVLLVDTGLPSVFAKLLTMACIVCWNFVLYRKVIFK
jgi:putative flippase GtrA